MPNLFIKKTLVAIIFFLVIFLLPQLISAADISPDAIAARVIPNFNHLSPLRWYQANVKTQGSPQSLQVDGYEAVRDGRTVYINTANISGNNFYTNIYVISYNQTADTTTLDIFGQILAHWNFNTNLSNPADKEKTVRDTKKLADLAEIKTVLENYKNKYGYYPKLSSGSYITGRSISTWPSWQATLGKESGITLPVDPINKLGSCGEANYNATTCWDENKKAFADPNPSDSNFELPVGSNAYVYNVDANGGNYNVCAIMESGYLTTLEQGACYGSASVKVGGGSFNNPPVIVCGALAGSPDKEFKGYVKAYDSDAVDSITSWTITDQTVAGWSPLKLNSSKVNNQKEVYSLKAGAPGHYSFVLEVSDSRGAKTSTICSITIKAVCGNTITESDEICDDGARNGQPNHCNSICSGITPATCGNGVKEEGEICDDGGSNGKPLKCNVSCSGITEARCGNGVKELGEDCDKKDNVATTPADSSSTKQYGCNISCQFINGYCGDNVKNGLETCDEGSSLNGTPNHCNKTCAAQTEPVCGNGVIEPGETCEQSIYVTPSPANSSLANQYSCGAATCKPNEGGYCGDGVKNGPDEVCDWKNYAVPSPASSSATNQYGCSSICKPEGGYCGDGVCIQKDGCSACAVDCKTGAGVTAVGFNALGECKATACNQAANYYLYNGGCVDCSSLAASSGATTVALNASGQCIITACQNGRHPLPDGSACVSNTQTVACTAKPTYTDWNTSSTVLQTWDGSAWQPSNSSSHSTTAGTCKFVCQSGYSWNGSVCSVCPIQTQVYTTATTGTNFTVPSGVTSIQVKAWGAGGGAGGKDSPGAGGAGGGGAYTMKTISVIPGQIIKIMVGGGGGGGASDVANSGGGMSGINGGSIGGNSGPSGASGAGGGGGGFSGVYNGSTPLIIAGAGAGGGGGGLNVNAGAGGAGGINGAGVGGGTAGASGSTTGKNGISNPSDGGGGGGGGGGYNGGNGGAYNADNVSGGAGGGGGNSLGDTIINGSGTSVGNSGDVNYGGNAGVGGAANGGVGNSGRVVLIYTVSCTP